MAWDFSTEPEVQEELDWVRRFVDEEVEPLALLWPHLHHARPAPWLQGVVDDLKSKVKERGLWACHLDPSLGGRGFGQVRLALMNEILGRNHWAPTIFGVQAPDTGNSEILAHYGTEEQKAKYLQPLLDGDIFSAFSMTEPHAGSDPREFTTRAELDGDEWVINGEKFFTSNAQDASLLIVMAVTNPDVDATKGMSMFLVPADTPGIEFLRDTSTMNEVPGQGAGHPHIRYTDVRVPADHILGEPGQAFVVAQTRLGGGRVHHSMRAVGLANRAFDMMCERALSRTTQGSLIADKQLVQKAIADSWAQIQQYRLFVLHTAWLIDNSEGTANVRKEIAAIKNMGAQVVHDVVQRAVHIHGALGVSNETPLAEMWMQVPQYAIWDGPSEVHTITMARQILKEHKPAPGLWPTEWLPERMAAAKRKFEDVLAAQAAYEAEHGPDRWSL